MGIFGRREQPAEGAATEPPLRPVVVTVEDLDAAERQIDAVLAAEVTTKVDLLNLALAADALDLDEIVRRGLSPLETKRLWTWLAEVGRQAPLAGRPLLAGKVFQFTLYWRMTIQPKFGMGDFMDVRFDPVPDEMLIQISRAAAEALDPLPADAVVWQGPHGVIDASTTLGYARDVIADPGGAFWPRG